MGKWDRLERFFKPLLPYLAFSMLGAFMAFAAPIKNWTTNEYITYTDLNANLNHLHASVGHGHGPVITAADISASAGIRPEQTTFGNSISTASAALVHVGTYRANPDGGTAYTPMNYTGSLTNVTVTGNATGFIVAASAASGVNPDGGTSKYTVFGTSVDLGFLGPTPNICYSSTANSIASPLNYGFNCQVITSFGGAAVFGSPQAVSIMVYDNKVQ